MRTRESWTRPVLQASASRGCPAIGWAEDLPGAPGLLEDYPELRESPLPESEQRTEWNVRDSDVTLIIGQKQGTRRLRGIAGYSADAEPGVLPLSSPPDNGAEGYRRGLRKAAEPRSRPLRERRRAAAERVAGGIRGVLRIVGELLGISQTEGGVTGF